MEYVSELPISLEEMFEKIQKSQSGSIIFHYAVVRRFTEDKVTVGIRFEKDGDTESELAVIASEIRNHWNIDDILLFRRIGTLHVGDIISMVAVSSPRSKDAFEACHYGVERLKKMVTLKKSESFLSQDKKN